MAATEISDGDFNMFKIVNYIKNAFLLITWFIASGNNKSAVSEIDLYADEMEDRDGDGIRDFDDDDDDVEDDD